MLVASAVDLKQKLSLLHDFIVVRIDFGDIARDLWADDCDLPTNIGVIRRLNAALEWWQLPRPQNHQHASKTDDKR
ncbi:hypothetical protein D3C79_1036250 [compost metagenome]